VYCIIDPFYYLFVFFYTLLAPFHPCLLITLLQIRTLPRQRSPIKNFRSNVRPAIESAKANKFIADSSTESQAPRSTFPRCTATQLTEAQPASCG
jgi:hypothetical protein